MSQAGAVVPDVQLSNPPGVRAGALHDFSERQYWLRPAAADEASGGVADRPGTGQLQPVSRRSEPNNWKSLIHTEPRSDSA